jgi:maltose O-acetyltransferase
VDPTGKADNVYGPIKVGSHVFIGNGAMIMPGVSVGDFVIIGAGAVVAKSVPDGSIVIGNPGRIVGTSDKFIEKYADSIFEKGTNNKETILAPNLLIKIYVEK